MADTKNQIFSNSDEIVHDGFFEVAEYENGVMEGPNSGLPETTAKNKVSSTKARIGDSFRITKRRPSL